MTNDSADKWLNQLFMYLLKHTKLPLGVSVTVDVVCLPLQTYIMLQPVFCTNLQSKVLISVYIVRKLPQKLNVTDWQPVKDVLSAFALCELLMIVTVQTK